MSSLPKRSTVAWMGCSTSASAAHVGGQSDDLRASAFGNQSSAARCSTSGLLAQITTDAPSRQRLRPPRADPLTPARNNGHFSCQKKTHKIHVRYSFAPLSVPAVPGRDDLAARIAALAPLDFRETTEDRPLSWCDGCPGRDDLAARIAALAPWPFQETTEDSPSLCDGFPGRDDLAARIASLRIAGHFRETTEDSPSLVRRLPRGATISGRRIASLAPWRFRETTED